MFRTPPAAIVALVLGLALLMVGSPPRAQAQPGSGAPQDEVRYWRGAEALLELGEELPVVAQAHGLGVAELRGMLTADPTLAVVGTDGLAYIEALESIEAAQMRSSEFAAEGSGAARARSGADEFPTAQSVTATTVFELASRPGAAKTIYLDFDGHVTEGTGWNSHFNVATITSPAYDVDGDPSSWSTEELARMHHAWKVTAEDFAPWDINVTTIDPGVEALQRNGIGDTEWGMRAVVTDDTFLSCNCGGIAGVRTFGSSVDNPAFIFNKGFRTMSETVSHEVGHTLGLAHDGTTSGSEYYRGHTAAGTPSWGSIMGAAFNATVVQWSQQEYAGANNTGASANFGAGTDDLAVIASLTNGNGFGYRADDHGNTLRASTPIADSQFSMAGIIETRTDIDVFSFVSTGGEVEINAAPPETYVANLDIALTLRDADGDVVATDNGAAVLDADVSVTVESGLYTVEVAGVGVGDPTRSSGYTDYASLGSYTVTGSIDGLAADLLPDADGSGAVDDDDVLALLAVLVGDRSAEIDVDAGDVIPDGELRLDDALRLIQCMSNPTQAICAYLDLE